RPARRHELRGPAARAPVLRAAAHRADSLLRRAPRREAGRHRLGPGALPLRIVGRRRDGKTPVRPLLHQAHVHRVRPHHRHRYGEGDRVRERSSVSSEAKTVTRNLSTRYLAIVAEMAVGLLVLPFNVSHLGKAAYGLWMLTTSVTAYFSVLDLGYSGALVK